MEESKSKIYIILLVTSLIVISSWFYFYSEKSINLQEDLRNNISLTADSLSKGRAQIILKLEEENNLRSQLDDIIEQYDNSRNEIDNLNIDLDDKQSEIDSLKSEIRDLFEEIKNKEDIENALKEAKKKIFALQNISKKYFEQVDSLLGATEQLVLENKNLEKEITFIKDKNKNLNKEINEKNQRLDLGSTLEVKKITFDKIKYGAHGKERKTIFRRNIQVLRCNLLISANKVAKAENKLVYIQYISPNGIILQSSSTPYESKFEYQDSTIQATTYSVFDYQNKEMEIEVDWQRGNILEKGEYKILVFIEGKLVGESSFRLN